MSVSDVGLIRPAGFSYDPEFMGYMPFTAYNDEDWVMKRRITTAANPSGPCHSAPVESRVLSSLHPLVSHCAVTRYDDGEARTPGTLLIRTVGATWQVTAKEPDAAAQLIVAAPSLDDALAALSLLLESDDTPWQPDPWARAQRPGKKR